MFLYSPMPLGMILAHPFTSSAMTVLKSVAGLIIVKEEKLCRIWRVQDSDGTITDSPFLVLALILPLSFQT